MPSPRSPAAPVAALLLALSGCYASHERPGPAVLACGASTITCPERSSAFARGVCVAEDGSVFAFADDTGDLACTGTDGDATRFGRVEACEAPARRARRVACCEPSADSMISGWVFEGRVLGAGVRVHESDPGCELVPREVPRGAFAPWEPTMLCDDPLAWSGVPLVFSLREPDADRCGGAETVERCSAELVSGRIVVTTESALADTTVCETVIGDRVADCAVLPLPAGAYEVVDRSGRVLGTIDVAAEPPVAREPRCVPLAR